MVRNPLHFICADFSSANIHLTIHLHRIGGDDFASYNLRQAYSQITFSGGCRAGKDDQWFPVHKQFLKLILDTFKLLVQFISGKMNHGRTSVRAGVWVICF